MYLFDVSRARRVSFGSWWNHFLAIFEDTTTGVIKIANPKKQRMVGCQTHYISHNCIHSIHVMNRYFYHVNIYFDEKLFQNIWFFFFCIKQCSRSWRICPKLKPSRRQNPILNCNHYTWLTESRLRCSPRHSRHGPHPDSPISFLFFSVSCIFYFIFLYIIFYLFFPFIFLVSLFFFLLHLFFFLPFLYYFEHMIIYFWVTREHLLLNLLSTF
jgi:hypothetical protein